MRTPPIMYLYCSSPELLLLVDEKRRTPFARDMTILLFVCGLVGNLRRDGVLSSIPSRFSALEVYTGYLWRPCVLSAIGPRGPDYTLVAIAHVDVVPCGACNPCCFRASFRWQHVSRANEELAVDSLLVTDGLFRSRCVCLFRSRCVCCAVRQVSKPF